MECHSASAKEEEEEEEVVVVVVVVEEEEKEEKEEEEEEGKGCMDYHQLAPLQGSQTSLCNCVALVRV